MTPKQQAYLADLIEQIATTRVDSLGTCPAGADRTAWYDAEDARIEAQARAGLTGITVTDANISQVIHSLSVTRGVVRSAMTEKDLLRQIAAAAREVAA